MVITMDHVLPSDEELTVPEVNLSQPALRAGAFHLGKHCEYQFNEFMLCREEEKDPRKCLKEGRDVTACALNFFRLVKKSCREEFSQYAHCLDKSSSELSYSNCRNTQNVYDKCMLDNVGIERPGYGYYCRAKVHATDRPKPPERERKIHDETPVGLPDDAPKPKANYGNRWIF